MGHDDDHDAAHKDGNVPWYCRPIQRQKWGEAQILPHTEWGNTFFDLFYVAGAYNLGTLLRTEPTSRGLLYFVACFFPLQNLWTQKMYYESRFWNPDDAFHRLYEFAVLVVLGTAVLHIRPVLILSDSKNNADMFCFSLSLAIAGVLVCGRSVELYFMGVGQPALKIASKRDFIWAFLNVFWYTAAAIVSGLEYYGNVESMDGDAKDFYYGNGSNYATESNISASEGDHHRGLAGPEPLSSAIYETAPENDVPIYLVLVGAMTFMVSMVLTVWLLPGGGKHKELIVPMNVTFGIHRWGEFTMLMLGESILSLLIVDVTDSSGYYETFFCGIVSITLLEFLHFRSQPHDADDHALRRSREASLVFTTLMQIYSASLVVLGTAYKMLLYEYVYEAKATGANRLLTGPFSRLLAASEEPRFSLDDRRQRTAHFFCISMAIVWLCSDLMIVNHRGLEDNLGRCRLSHTGFLKFVSAILALLRLGLVCFIATLSQYVTEPSLLAIVGLVGIIGEVLLRVVGSAFFGPVYGHNDDPENESNLWPNVTQPQVEEEHEK